MANVPTAVMPKIELKPLNAFSEEIGKYRNAAGTRNIGIVAINFIIAPTKAVGLYPKMKTVDIIDTPKAWDKPYRKNAKTQMTPTKSIFIPHGTRNEGIISAMIARADRTATLAME